jgi:hypothetical protein
MRVFSFHPFYQRLKHLVDDKVQSCTYRAVMLYAKDAHEMVVYGWGARLFDYA